MLAYCRRQWKQISKPQRGKHVTECKVVVHRDAGDAMATIGN